MRAVVLGAGPAGLVAAAALARAGHQVLLVESDVLTDSTSSRPGTPQGSQLHNLLGRAQLHLEQLLPGFVRELLARGGVAADVSTQTHVFELGVRMPQQSCGLRLVCAPRHVIEQVAHQLLPPSVEILDGTRALGLDLDRNAVRAVHTSAGRLPAELVIDAMGSRSLTPEWMRRAGLVKPKSSTFTVRQWYCSLIVERPPEWVGRPDFWLTFPTSPRTRGGLISPVGHDRWYVSVSGTAADKAPRSTTDFFAYARTLEDSMVSDVLVDSSPLGDPRIFGKPVARWRHYEAVPVSITGLLPLGDAVAALNPLLGQGISVAASQAAKLSEVDFSAEPTEWTRRFSAQAAAIASDAWSLTRVFEPTAHDVPRLSPQDWGRIVMAVRNDECAHHRYVKVWHLLEPPAALAEIARVAVPG